MKTLDRQKTGWQQKAAQYEQELSGLQKQLHDIADEYRRLNLDDLNANERKAVQLFKEGKIDESIQLRESLNSEQEIKKALRRKAADDSVIVANTRNLQNLAKEYQLKFDFAKAEATLEKLALTDTTNSANTYLLGTFLKNQKQYDKAIKYFLISLRHTSEENQTISILSDLGLAFYQIKEYALCSQTLTKAYTRMKNLSSDNLQVYEPVLAGALANLGIAYYANKEFVLAEQTLLTSLETMERVAKINPQTFDPHLVRILNILGVIYNSQEN